VARIAITMDSALRTTDRGAPIGRLPGVDRTGDHRDDPSAGSVGGDDARVAERQLIDRCVAGEGGAWRVLYERHFPKVERLVSALGVSGSEADDLCQEIFLLIHRYLPKFRGDALLGTWIHRLAAREAVRFARRRRLRQKLAQLFARERVAPPRSGTEAVAGDRAFLLALLDRLPPERRLALVLHEIEGVPAVEIARLAGCAEATIWTRLHRARRDLERLAREQTT